MRTARIQKSEGRRGRLYILLMVGFLMVVMVVQLVMLYNKSEEYLVKEAQLEQDLKEQEGRQKELSEYELYTKSDEYIKNMAKSKLGLVSPNEIIFRER
ncbi:MAG: septum formation initiator family protein [Lachnospiraceae bacterium]|nr:septum formation initiator family protein [Lachnospiraceae bacterium]